MTVPAPLPRTPSFGLVGKKAIITGAGSGIGAAAAAALAQAGASVTLCGRTLGALEKVARDIRSDMGRDADAVSIDVTEEQEVRALFAERGPFDILVNSAGTNCPKPFAQVTPADYDTVMNLNLRASFFVAQAAAAGMVRGQKKGSIVHISSQMGHVGGEQRTVYCASKWGLEGLSKAMALDLAPHGIRVNTIAPTFLETPMTRAGLQDPVFRAAVLNKIKMGRLGQVEDVMGGIVFLASDASSLMTGASLVIDGGWTAE